MPYYKVTAKGLAEAMNAFPNANSRTLKVKEEDEKQQKQQK